MVAPPERRSDLDDLLGHHPGVCNLVVLTDAARRPTGDLVVFDVAREAANSVIDDLRTLGLHVDGSITIDRIDASLSVHARRAEDESPGDPSEAVVWEEVEARVRHESSLSPSLLIYMVIASLIAAIGILTDAPILIVGAMVVGPEYGPISGMMLGILKRRPRRFLDSAVALIVGFAVALGVAFVYAVILRSSGRIPMSYELGQRPLTTFISRPDGFAVVVAICAAVAGALSLTQARSGTLVGVFISVTTIPAVADCGVSLATSHWSEAGGAAVQLTINVFALVVVGAGVLRLQFLLWPRRRISHGPAL